MILYQHNIVIGDLAYPFVCIIYDLLTWTQIYVDPKCKRYSIFFWTSTLLEICFYRFLKNADRTETLSWTDFLTGPSLWILWNVSEYIFQKDDPWSFTNLLLSALCINRNRKMNIGFSKWWPTDVWKICRSYFLI